MTRVGSTQPLAALARALEGAGSRDRPPALGAAVSGGLDSIALLEALVEVLGRGGAARKLVVLHLDHGLREDSAADAEAVRELAAAAAARLDVPVTGRVERVAEGSLPAAGPSLEARARHERYAFFRRVAEEERLDLLLLAHHRDDQLETVAHNLLRGSGAFELAGMPAERPLAPGHATRLLRPFLDLDRAELARFARERGLRPREDATNRSLGPRRNRIRHLGLPPLAADAAERLAALDRASRELGARAEALLDGVADRLGPYPDSRAPFAPWAARLARGLFLDLPLPLARAALARAMALIGEDGGVPAAALRRLRADAPGPAVELGPGCLATWRDEELVVASRRGFERREARAVAGARGVRAEDLGLGVRLRPGHPGETGDGRWRQALPAVLAEELVLRSARPEDRIRPLGRGRTTSLERHLEAGGIPAARRTHFPVFADADGPLWAPGLAPDERCRVDAEGGEAVTIELRPL
ncbi:MAG: tRNA lysidine(34) synthetase TilS [Planctomycetota bacterium]